MHEGRTRQAVKLCAANVTVGAGLSLAGIGFDRRKIKIYTDPNVERNTHEVVARGLWVMVAWLSRYMT